MSLDWSIRNVDNHDELVEDEREALITNALVWHTLAIGLGDITQSNWQEFYARTALMEQLEKPSITVPKWVPTEAHRLSGNDTIIRFPDDDPNKLYYFHSLYYDGYEQSDVLEVRDYNYAQGMGPSKGETPRLFVLNSASDWQTIEYHDGFERRAITPQDVHRRIGLRTNVMTTTRSKWAKRTIERELDNRIKRAARYAK